MCAVDKQSRRGRGAGPGGPSGDGPSVRSRWEKMVGERWSEGQEREGAGEGLAGRAGEAGEGQGMNVLCRDGWQRARGRERTRGIQKLPPKCGQGLEEPTPLPQEEEDSPRGSRGGGRRPEERSQESWWPV